MSEYPSNKYDPFSSEGKVELDFPVLRLWWKNGNAKAIPDELDDAAKAELRKKLGVTYYGGWCAHHKDADEALAAMGNTIIPGFQLVTMSGSKNSKFEVYTARQVSIAPILKRLAWFTPEEPGSRPYSRHEILSYIAVPDPKTKTFVPWGLAVLSGRSTSGLAVVNTIAAWGRKIEKIIETPATQPIWAHWVTLGTLRADIYVEMRGKGNNTSPVTPCEFYLPEDKIPLKEFVAKRYIGSELQTQCEEYRTLSIAWAQYWNERVVPMKDAKSGPETPDNFPADVSGEVNGNDIPF